MEDIIHKIAIDLADKLNLDENLVDKIMSASYHKHQPQRQITPIPEIGYSVRLICDMNDEQAQQFFDKLIRLMHTCSIVFEGGNPVKTNEISAKIFHGINMFGKPVTEITFSCNLLECQLDLLVSQVKTAFSSCEKITDDENVDVMIEKKSIETQSLRLDRIISALRSKHSPDSSSKGGILFTN